MDKKICTNCNGNDLFLYNLEGPATTYVCTKCGHMEWFLNNDTIRLFFEHEKQQLENEKINLQNQIYELNKIFSDENIPIKIIKEAKENMGLLQEKLKIIDTELQNTLISLDKMK